ncbi:acyl-CoA carboxylase subunit epsilon [Streptomyces mutabilis]|uniref:Acyl-CoA carboxylase subunit epsilon n=1 Tax=Streptomyces mutabilis TaxID=67332 RepID=A0A086MRM5_9ACTN|nr:acyl-CoA carboxylase subunit epsilon [Streptomyces mutabilis]KFG71543.1 hypothetical protein FM21_32570 [Streptomyces mutabilis]
MAGAGRKDALLRIERGQATEEELAAVAVTLFALLLGHSRPPAARGGERSVALWRRTERARAYQASHSWM